jgi:hypothetical protein
MGNTADAHVARSETKTITDKRVAVMKTVGVITWHTLDEYARQADPRQGNYTFRSAQNGLHG